MADQRPPRAEGKPAPRGRPPFGGFYPPLGGPGRPGAAGYAIVAAGSSAVLVELGTGRTWVLTQGVDGDSVWLPARRLDSDQEVRRWRRQERAKAAAREALQRELARKLEALQREVAAKVEALQREMTRKATKGVPGEGGKGPDGPDGPGKGPPGADQAGARRLQEQFLARMRTLTPAQRRDQLNQIPEAWRDRARQLLRSKGLKVAD
jgi:hypothetical protein